MFENLQSQSTGLQQALPQQQPSQMQAMQKQMEEMKNQLSMLRNAQNPQAILQQLVDRNPGMRAALNEAQAMYNGDPKAMFMAKAKAKGWTDAQIADFEQKFRQVMG